MRRRHPRALCATVAVAALVLTGCGMGSDPEVALPPDSEHDESNIGHGADNDPCQNLDPSANAEADLSAEAQAAPPRTSCEQPGSDEDADGALIIDTAAIDTDEDIVNVQIKLTNVSDQSRRIILPSSVRPRVDQADGTQRLSFLRANFTQDDDGNPKVDVDNLGQPDYVTVGAYDTYVFDDEILLTRDQLADQMLVCVEVHEPAPENTPAAAEETGHESVVLPADIGFGPGATVPLLCSDVIDVGRS